MSRKARANARRRKGNHTTSTTTATRSRQAIPSSVVAASRGQRQKDAPVRDLRSVTDASAPQRLSPAVAVAVATAAEAADGGADQQGSERPVGLWGVFLPMSISRVGVTDNLARQLTLARSVAASYLRSRWFVAEVVGVVGLFALCFGTPFDGAYFFRIAGFALGLFALFGTYVLDHTVASPRVYLRRSLRSLGRPTVAPLVIAATITRVVSFGVLLALVFIFRRFAVVEPIALVVGTVGLLANCALVAAGTVACSTPYARRGMQLGVLAWLVAGLATYNPDTIFSSIPIVSGLMRLVLLPFATSYSFGVTGAIGWSGVAALVAEAGMIAASIAITDSRLHRRLQKHERSVEAG